MALVIPPSVQQLPQAQPQQTVQPRPEIVQLAQNKPIAAQTQRAVAGTSRSRGADGAKSEGKHGQAGATDEKATETSGATPQRRREGGVTIDV